MKGSVDNFLWAKKKEHDGNMYWLSLRQHLEDTKNVAGLLWEHWLGNGQKKLINDSLDDNSKGKGKNLIEFLAAVHDIGKATPYFQTMKGYMYSPELDLNLLNKLEKIMESSVFVFKIRHSCFCFIKKGDKKGTLFKNPLYY